VITARVIDPSVNKVLATMSVSAGGGRDVLHAVGTLAARVRGILGDTTPESARRAAAETFTTSSLEAVGAYWTAQDLATSGKYAESIQYYRRAIQFDPRFGRAYAGWATSA